MIKFHPESKPTVAHCRCSSNARSPSIQFKISFRVLRRARARESRTLPSIEINGGYKGPSVFPLSIEQSAARARAVKQEFYSTQHLLYPPVSEDSPPLFSTYHPRDEMNSCSRCSMLTFVYWKMMNLHGNIVFDLLSGLCMRDEIVLVFLFGFFLYEIFNLKATCLCLIVNIAHDLSVLRIKKKFSSKYKSEFYNKIWIKITLRVTSKNTHMFYFL